MEHRNFSLPRTYACSRTCRCIVTHLWIAHTNAHHVWSYYGTVVCNDVLISHICSHDTCEGHISSHETCEKEENLRNYGNKRETSSIKKTKNSETSCL